MATYTLISSNVLSSSAASVTFSAIPATYTDLVLRVSARSDRASTFDDIKLVFNSDTSAIYSATELTGNGSSATSTRTSADSAFRLTSADAATATSNTFGSFELYLPNYLSTASKPMGTFGVQETNATGAIMDAGALLFRNTTAISSVVISPWTGPNWVSGSSFYLYGISNA